MHAHGEDPRLAQMLARELERFRPVSRGAQIYLDPNVAGAVETPWESIVYPLAASAHLVFLASPGAAQSTRCQQAVKYWLARHPPDTVTLVLASGEIRWDEKWCAFDKKVTNALPPGLLKVYRSEPPYFDLRRGYPSPGSESGATRLDTISRLGPRVFGCPWEDLMSAYMDAQWCAESEVHDVRGELSLLRRDPARAVREWVEAYRRRPTFDVLLKLVRTYHHDCLPVASPCALPFTPLLATWINEVGLVIVDGSRRSGEGSVVCMNPGAGSRRWSATCPEPLDARSVGTRDGRLYFFTRDADDGTELPAPVAISGFGYGSTERSLPHRITCFDTATKRVHHLASVSHPRELAIDLAGRRLAFSEGDGIHLCTLDTRSGDPGLALVRSFKRVVMTDPINELDFVESLQALAFCSGADSQLDASGDAVGLLDLATGEPKWTAKLHDKQVNTINVSPDERRMVSASNDGTIALWDVRDGKLLHRWRVDDLPVRAARFTPSGRRIVSVTETGTQVWDGRSGALLRLIPGACGILVMDPAQERFWVLGTTAVCIDLEATRRIADLNDGGTLIADVAFDADGRHAVAVCRSSGWYGFLVLNIYDTRTGTRIAQCKPGVDHVSLYRAGLSTTGRYLVRPEQRMIPSSGAGFQPIWAVRNCRISR